MCSKRSSFYLFLIFFFFNGSAFANNDLNKKAIDYLERLDFFSASFIQDNEDSINEGKIFIGSERIRVEYYSPSKILIVLDKNKAMYYNYDLEEDEFFDPSKTSAGFFFNIFKNPDFFKNSKTVSEDNYLVLKKSGINDEETFHISIFFENNPFILRKIKLIIEDSVLILSIFDHNFNENFDENFFKLINPEFFDGN